MPLCPRYHRTGRDSYHKLGPRAFERQHGLDLRAIVVSDQLGHASISFTLERYCHVLPSIQDEAAAKVERMLMG